MRSFVEVVKKGNYTQAAKFLGTSRALVSRHVLDLEAQLKVRLLHRTTRAITLTEDGRKYFEFCERILTEIRETEEAMMDREKSAQGNLAIVAPKWIGNHEVADAATSFAIEYPDISLKLSLGGMAPNAYDFIEQGYDIALHTRRLPDSLVRAKLIANIEFILCASPEYLYDLDSIKTPSDLAGHKGIIQSNDPFWRLEEDGKMFKVKIKTTFSSNTYVVLRRAALKGMGVAMLPLSLVRADLEGGRLVQVLKDYPFEERPLFAAFGPGEIISPKVRLFIDFLTTWFHDNPM